MNPGLFLRTKHSICSCFLALLFLAASKYWLQIEDCEADYWNSFNYPRPQLDPGWLEQSCTMLCFQMLKMLEIFWNLKFWKSGTSVLKLVFSVFFEVLGTFSKVPYEGFSSLCCLLFYKSHSPGVDTICIYSGRTYGNYVSLHLHFYWT